MAFGSLILTNAANSFTAQAWASSGVITITRVGFGSGFPGVTDFVPGYTGLKVPVMNGTITGINNLVAGQLTVRSNISSANAPFTFNVNEIGIFGKYAGGAETLLAYCTTGSNTGDTVVPTGGGTPVVKDYALLMIWQQAISSSGVIQLIQQVGLHAGSHLNTGVDPISVASSSHTGFVPISPGDGTQVPISTSPVTWSPALLVIRVNTTLYVSTSGNDSTAKPNDITHPWLTVQGALSYLSPYFIEPSATVTVSIAVGVYTSTSPISIVHPNANQIVISGTVGSSVSASSVSYTGSYPNLTAFCTVPTGHGISSGDYVTFSGNAHYMDGVFSCTSSSTNSVSLSVVYYRTAIAGSAPSAATLVKLGTVLKFTGCHGIQGSNCLLGSLSNCALISDGTNASNAVYGTENFSINIGINVGIANGWLVGLSAQIPGIFINCTSPVYVSGNSTGIYADQGGSVSATGAIITSNVSIGVRGNNNSIVNITNAFVCGNGDHGLYCSFGTIYANGTQVWNNATPGLFSVNMGKIALDGGGSVNNGASDYMASLMAYITANPHYIIGYTPIFSPAPNTVGNQNSYINAP